MPQRSSTRASAALAARPSTRRRSVVAAVLLTVLATLLPAGTAHAVSMPHLGNYCSMTWPDGGWAFASDAGGGDPCGYIRRHADPGGSVNRAGLYDPRGVNNVVVRCNEDQSWVGLYQGWGNGPLTAAFDSARERDQRHCIFTVSPLHLPIFGSPFSLAAPYQHVTGFDYARGSYTTLNVAEFGQPGSSAATLVNGRGEERPGYVDNHHGNDWLLPKGTPITAVAGGKVIMARAYKSPCEDISDSQWQLELTILHTVQGSSGYYEHFATYYAHFSELAVSEGDVVTKGQVVGYAGNTGCSSASHLHFGAYKLTNTASSRYRSLSYFDGPDEHNNGGDFEIDAYGFTAPKGFDPWAWRAYPAGALSVNLWQRGAAPSQHGWQS